MAALNPIKNVLVYGGSGALGRAVVSSLKRKNPENYVIGVDLGENKDADKNIVYQAILHLHFWFSNRRSKNLAHPLSDHLYTSTMKKTMILFQKVISTRLTGAEQQATVMSELAKRDALLDAVVWLFSKQLDCHGFSIVVVKLHILGIKCYISQSHNRIPPTNSSASLVVGPAGPPTLPTFFKTPKR